jgi:uncharacterized LabA/DUF88 family protein
MDRQATQIVERLGPVGLARALDDLVGERQLVRLANACGLKYPGMRTQSQSRGRLIEDLVKQGGERPEARRAILRILLKETDQAAREWAELAPEERTRRLADDDFLLVDGNLGRHLFLLASGEETRESESAGAEAAARRRLLRLAGNGAAPGTSRPSREQNRLKRQLEERERKLRHLETQLAKARETQKTIKWDLIQRKGELAESRMLVERLRRELASAQSAAQAVSADRPVEPTPDAGLAEVRRAMRQLTSEHRKLAHRLDKLLERPAPQPAAASESALAPLVEHLTEIRRALAAQRDERSAWRAAQDKLLDELRGALRSRREETAGAGRPSRKARPRGPARRVGVFIDVQNMYYGARRLKGKLDFDALLQAAVQDRRLIRATAYVVESKETDQSQFIAMLEKRAIDVRRKALRVRADGSMKGDWDMELALDILDSAPSLDVVVLVSGDGDFTSLVRRVKAMGPQVEVVAFPRNTAKSLVEVADRFQPLDRRFMIYERRTRDDASPTDGAEHAVEDGAAAAPDAGGRAGA